MPASAQITGPVAPALTPDQIALSKSLAARHNQADAKEQRRLETFKDRPLAAIIQRSFDIYTNYVGLAAEMMPESGYEFRPTPELRNFGEQINHASSTQYLFCNQTGLPPGVERQSMPRPAPTTRAAIIEAFQQSTAYCDRVLAAAPESWLMEIVPAVAAVDGQSRFTCPHLHLQHRPHRRRLQRDHDLPAHAGRMPPSSALDERPGRSGAR